MKPRECFRAELLTPLFADIAGSTEPKPSLSGNQPISIVQCHLALVRELRASFPAEPGSKRHVLGMQLNTDTPVMPRPQQEEALILRPMFDGHCDTDVYFLKK